MTNNYYNQPPRPFYGGYQSPQVPPSVIYAEHKKPLRRWANVIGGGLLLVQVVMAVVMGILQLVFNQSFFSNLSIEGWDVVDQSVQFIAYVLGFFVPTMFMMRMINIPPQVAYPVKRPRVSMVIVGFCIALGASMVGSMINGSLTYVMEYLFDLTPTTPDMSAPVGIAPNIVYVLSMTVAPGIFEEMMFRGVIMQSLRRFGDGFALCMSSVLFGMIHGNIIQGSNAILLGLVMGYFVLRTGSILTSMIIHCFYNGFIIMFNYMMDYMTLEQSSMFDSAIFTVYLLLGVAGVVYMLVKEKGFVRLIPSNYPLTTGQKVRTFTFAVTIILFILLTLGLTAIYFE